MKKVFLYSLAAILTIMSCSREITTDETITLPEENFVTISTSIEGQTKTTLTENTSTMKAEIGWSTGDKISVLYKDGGYKKTEFTTTAGDGTFTGTPSGTEGGDVAHWAIYPYNICTDLYPSSGTKESTTITLPTEYTGNGADGIPMNVHTLNANFDGTYHFKHMGAVLRFAFTNIPSTARKLVISHASYDLAGRYYTTYDSANDLIYYTTGTSGDGEQRSVTYNFTPNMDGTYSFYLPFGVTTPSGSFTFTFKDSEGADICSRTTTLGALASVALVRNTLYRLKIDVMSFEGYPLSSITIGPTDVPDVPSDESDFTVSTYTFHGVRVDDYSNQEKDIKFYQNGDSKDARIYNISDFGRIARIVISKGATAYYRDSYTMYAGSTSNPTITEIPVASYTETTTTYNFTTGDYHYFNFRIKSTSSNQYFGTIQIYYKP